jgi:hypothetical protein
MTPTAKLSAPIIYLANPRDTLEVTVDPSLAGTPGVCGLRELIRIIGLRATASNAPDPTLYYGVDEQLGRRAAIWIQPQLINSPTLANFVSSRLPSRDNLGALWNDRRLTIDLPRATAFWLTLESENTIIQRDEHGRVRSRDSMLAQQRLLDDPPVHHYAAILGERLHKVAPTIRPHPLWPHGKSYAVALTHDVDLPERKSTIEQVLDAKRTNRVHSWRQAYWLFREHLKREGLSAIDIRPPRMRHEWDFDRLTSLEENSGLRSAFYFATTNRRQGCNFDVTYDFTKPRYAGQCRRLLNSGWEVGLHAGYLAASTPGRVSDECSVLSNITGRPLHGTRHHYLHMHDSRPMETMREQYLAGLNYDASIGFNDAPGFRAGIALPYFPVNEVVGDAPFVELPMTLADMHLPSDDIAEACNTVTQHLATVRDLNGLAVLNWHIGHSHSHPAWREAYRTACETLAGDHNAWVATPRQIAAWWLERSARFFDYRQEAFSAN